MSDTWLKVYAPRPVKTIKAGQPFEYMVVKKIASIPRLLAGLIERLHTVGPCTHREGDGFDVLRGNRLSGAKWWRRSNTWRWLVWPNGRALLLSPSLSTTLDDCVSQGYAEMATVADVEHRDVYTWSITPKGTEIAEIILLDHGPGSAAVCWSAKFFGEWEGWEDRVLAENFVSPKG